MGGGKGRGIWRLLSLLFCLLPSSIPPSSHRPSLLPTHLPRNHPPLFSCIIQALVFPSQSQTHAGKHTCMHVLYVRMNKGFPRTACRVMWRALAQVIAEVGHHSLPPLLFSLTASCLIALLINYFISCV